jgi:chromosome partitioning protein
MARIIAVVNPKGGVGKTNVAINLSVFLSAKGKKVLLVDLSPQGDATFSLGLKDSLDLLSKFLLGRISSEKAIKKNHYFNHDILPSSPNFVFGAQKLAKRKDRKFRLKKGLEKIEKTYDFIIIDSPPGFGVLVQNAIYASKEIIVPIQCQYLALKGAKDLLLFLRNLKPKPRVEKIGFLLTMYSFRSKSSREIAKIVRESFAKFVFGTAIPQAIALSRSLKTKEPILKYAPNSRAARAYEQLTQEVLNL